MSNPKVKKLQFAFRQGARYSIDAEDAGKELDRIRKAHGQINPHVVVEESKPETAPLHPVFEWNDEKAAGNYRAYQARALIRSVTVVQETDGVRSSSPVYVNVPTGNAETSGYQPVSVVVNRPDMFASAIGELSRKVRAAQEAVEMLHRSAQKAPDTDNERMARISIAVQAMDTANKAVAAIH